MSLKYRADIDGLRALAVLAVIFFHAGVPGFSGGFVGVDVFFVISGFLITSIILKDIHTGKFSIAKFYERRIRRIFPALFPVIAFTVVVGFFIFDPGSFKELGKSIIATTFFSSNILFLREVGYFDADAITKPLLHTWSLAIEEQFYIFFPLLLIAIHRFSESRYFQWLLGIGLVSLLTSIYGVYTNQAATFYLVPTRAWELLFGSIFALGVIPQLQTTFHRNLFSIVGFSLIILSIWRYSEATLFPGAAALAPVLGAGLIIYSGIGGGESAISKLLTLKPLVFIGLISYSLYLWHWPLIVFIKYLSIKDLTPLEITGIIVSSLTVSTLSWKFIEQPFRLKQMLFRERKKLFAISCVVMIAFSGIGGGIYLQNKERNYNLTSTPEAPTLIGDRTSAVRFVLWGDSHAGALAPAINTMAIKYGISGYIFSVGSTLPILGMEHFNNSSYENTLNRNIFSFINKNKIKAVFLSGAWSHYIEGKGEFLINGKLEKPSASRLSSIVASMDNTVRILQSMGKDVYVVFDVPCWNINPVRFIYLKERYPNIKYFSSCIDSVCYREDYVKYNNKFNIKAFNTLKMQLPSNHFLYPDLYFHDKNFFSRMYNNHKILYNDSNHLSSAGAIYVAPVFDEIFQKIGRKR